MCKAVSVSKAQTAEAAPLAGAATPPSAGATARTDAGAAAPPAAEAAAPPAAGAAAPPPSALPPGPAQPRLLQTLWWLTRPISFMEHCRKRHPDAFSVSFLGFQQPTVFLSHPDVVKALYTEQSHGLPPGRTLALRPVLGPDSVLLLEGRQHLMRRKLMLPPFHGERMRSYQSIVSEAAEREIASWPAKRPFPLHPRMQAITLEVILKAVFGVTDPQRLHLLRDKLPQLLTENSSIWLQLRILLSRRSQRGDPLARLQGLLSDIDAAVFAEIAERRAEMQKDGEQATLAKRDDILSLLIAARFEDGSQMGDTELRDQLLTLLLAGHETTATALAWTIDLLLRNPDSLAKLTAEVDSNDADGGEDEYMRAVITESLRLRPVVPLAGRRLATDLHVGDLHLPAGADVTPAIWLTHTRPDLYPEPLSFKPERFLQGSPPTYGWIPFGGGTRRCLGASFAEFEMRVVLRSILSSTSLSPVKSSAEGIARRNVTFSPRHGTVVTAAPRVTVHAPSPPTAA